MGERADERNEKRSEDGTANRNADRSEDRNADRSADRPTEKYRGKGSLGESKPAGSSSEPSRDQDHHDLEETLDRQRHGSGEYDPEERYGRRDTVPDREQAGPGDEDEPDTAEEEPKRGRSPRKQDPT